MSACGQYQTAVIGNKGSEPSIGNIYYSIDYGVSWTECLQTFKLNWSGVAMSACGQYQTAVARNNISPSYISNIYYSIDYGVNWIECLQQFNLNWLGVAMSSSGQHQTISEDNHYASSIYHSSNYGVTWTKSITNSLKGGEYIAMSSSGQYQMSLDYTYAYQYIIPYQSLTANGFIVPDAPTGDYLKADGTTANAKSSS
jgi:hypothetical protein